MKTLFHGPIKLPLILSSTLFISAMSVFSSCKKDVDATDDNWQPRRHSWHSENRNQKKGLSVETDADKMAVTLSNDTTGNVAVQIETDDEMISEARKIGGEGELKLTMLWDFQADVDIRVEEPSGKIINYMNPQSETGGFLDVDNRTGGSGSAENIYWENPPRGHYRVWVHYYGPSAYYGTYGSGPVNVIVFRKDAEPRTFQTQLYNMGDQVFITSFDID